MKIENALHGNRIRIRNYEPSDLNFLKDMWLHEDNGRYMTDPTAAYVNEAYEKALHTLQDSEDGYYLVVEHKDTRERIGSAGMFPDEAGKIWDIGYCIHRSQWRQGYGSEVIPLLIAWAKKHGAIKITAEVAVENLPSNRLLQKFGFSVEKKTEFKKYHMDVRFDSYIYALSLPPRIACCWEHNKNDTLLYAMDFPGAFTRGDCLSVAMSQMSAEMASYLAWRGEAAYDAYELVVTEEKESELNIRDADSDVIFEQEKTPLTAEEYEKLKALALKSAKDFLLLYESIPDTEKLLSPPRQTFYGQIPHTASAMYAHTKSVNAYYFGEISVPADNEGSIYECRKRGFEVLESASDPSKNTVFEGSYGEYWSLRKVLRRFIWHDRIHAKAMWRRAAQSFGESQIANPFLFR